MPKLHFPRPHLRHICIEKHPAEFGRVFPHPYCPSGEEGPDNRNDDHTNNECDKAERNTDLQIIVEGVLPRSEYQRVRRCRNRRCKGSRCRDTDTHQNGFRIRADGLRHRDSERCQKRRRRRCGRHGGSDSESGIRKNQDRALGHGPLSAELSERT